MSGTKSINLKTNLFDLIGLKIKDPLLGFDSVDEYVNHILEKALEIENSSGKKSISYSS